jgi:glucose-6-phosphate isomerase
MTRSKIDKRVEILKIEQLSQAELKDREITLEMAEHVWQKVKGYPIPESYSEEDRLSIFERYYHRASAQSQGE